MKADTDKSSQLATNESPIFFSYIEELIVKNSIDRSILGITIDSRLSFQNHVSLE